MANLFDQYIEATQSRSYLGDGSRAMRPELSTTGIINVDIEKDEPMFKKIKIDIRPPDPVTSLTVRSNLLVFAMSNKAIFRVDLRHASTPDEIDISDKAVGNIKINQLFLDPTGHHLLVGLSGRDGDPNINAVYIVRNSKKVKLTNKLKGHVLTAVGWNPHNTKENSTGSIILGTSKGLIFETELVMGDDWNWFQTNVEIYWKQAFDVGRSGATVVTGLEFHKYPNSDTKYFILATTPSRLYQFLGNVAVGSEAPILHNIFNNYLVSPERFVEIPGDLGYSQLQFYSNPAQNIPTTFAWMTGPGILHGQIDCSGQAGHDSVTKDTKLFLYPEEGGGSLRPIAIALTEFHVLILFQDRLKAVCLLNEQLVFQDNFVETYGKMLGMVKDTANDKLYVYSERTIFTYHVSNESRNVWKIYLDKGEFALAKSYCKNNPVNLDKVISKQAEDYFIKKKYMESAKFYALSQTSFEQIALKFMSIDQPMALKTFLVEKMTCFKPQETTQLTMIVTWVVELYLNQLGSIRDCGEKKSEKYESLKEEFYAFLDMKFVSDCINNNRNTIYNLISSHGDQESLIWVADLLKDYERVVSHCIQNGDFSKALNILQTHKKAELFYQYSPVLMQACPQETVTAWISQGRKLEPTKLIPALLQCDKEKESIRYLEFCVQVLDKRETSIHNYLLSLYARRDSEKLMTYLTLQGQDPTYVCYDLKYALRVCSEYKHTKACVLIYSTMGLYEEAVDLALQVDVDLAKQNADRPEENNELRKKLWLKIARHVVKEENNITRAMEFLQECDLIKIEDILPFFPDFVTIEQFKDAICSSLQDYNQHIDFLQGEMKDATESAQEIRAEIQTFRNRFAFVQGLDKCAICGFSILTRAFYLFPCEHKFHTDCLTSEVIPHLNTAKRNRVREIRQLISQYQREADLASNTTKLNALSSSRDHVKVELDDLIAAECLYCGEMMIKSIDTPFIEPEDFEEELRGWE